MEHGQKTYLKDSIKKEKRMVAFAIISSNNRPIGEEYLDFMNLYL